MENENFVVLKNVCKKFGDNTVIGDLDLEIKKRQLSHATWPFGLR